MSGRAVGVALCLAALIVYLAASSIYIVNEGEQALVVRLGAPIGVADKPGLKFKAPFVDSVYVTSTRSLLLEPPLEQVIMGDEKRLEVQPYARYRIVDPLRFYQALRTSETANAQLAQLVSSSARRELGQIPLRTLLTEERGHILDIIKGEVAAKAEPLGIKVDEVRFDRSDLPFETSQAIYDRMKSERQREAKELRAQGFEWAQQIEARADHDRTVILSEARRYAAVARGDGDAEANQALAAAYSQDPQFYSFYRSLQTYRNALANSAPTMVVSPEADSFELSNPAPGPRRLQRRSRRAPSLEPAARRSARQGCARATASPFRSERAEGGLDLIDGVAWIVVLVQILCVDLLLGADNAVVIALACSRLPAEETRRAVVLGAVGAIALRLGMLAFANALLAVPLVKLIAAWTLVVIALNVRARKAGDERPAAAGAAGDFITAAAVIMLADAAMSLDNVVALAAIAGGSFWLLALGVVLSIPIIAFGSLILSGIIRRAPSNPELWARSFSAG